MQYYTQIHSSGQAQPGNPFSETQASCRPPQIIGEGDVASFVLPDGSIQLYFVPSPFPRGPSSPNYPPFINQQQQQQQQQQQPWQTYPEAWLIRSVPEQLIAYPNPNVSRPQCQPDNSNPSFLQSRYQSRAGYLLKFHNDGWTSTTDIHHFDPASRQRAWFPRQNTGTQIASPPSTPLSDGSRTVQQHACNCTKPCQCFDSYARREQVHNIFLGTTYEPEKNDIERSSVEVLHDKREKKTTRFGRETRGCDPEWLEMANKVTATYTSTATGSGGEASGTQTGCGAGVAVRRVGSFFRDAGAAELWYPASPAARLALARPGDSSPPASGSDD